MKTTNHGLSIPEFGDANWHVQLNDNFRRLEQVSPLLVEEEDLPDLAPYEGALVLTTDTRAVYCGDGDQWTLLGELRAPGESSVADLERRVDALERALEGE